MPGDLGAGRTGCLLERTGSRICNVFERKEKEIVMKKILIFLLALASCSKELGTTPTANDGRIHIVAGVDGSKTRAIADASTGLTGASFVIVESATTPASFAGGTVYTGDVAATSGEVTFTSNPAPTYNLNDQNAWLAAYAPGGALTNDAIEWTIDGKTDILVTNTIWDAGKYSAPVTTGLNFNHLLTRIEVKVQAEPGAALGAVQDAWGEITKIEFVDAPEKMKYDLSDIPTVTTSGNANVPLLKDYDGTAFVQTAIPANGAAEMVGVAMLAPVTPTATESFKLKITTAKPVTAEILVSLDGSKAAMTAGHTHTVALTFKANAKEIEVATSTIDGWGTGASGDSDVEVPVVPVVGNYVYDDGSFSKRLDAAKTPVGVVFWVNPDDADNFKIVSLDETSIEWGGFPATTYTTGETNGAENMAVIRAISGWHDAFKAFAWCDDKREGGSGWYLPAKNELQYLFCASMAAAPVTWESGDGGPVIVQAKRDTWNARFTAAGVAGAEFAGDYYWSATESSTTSGYVWVVGFYYSSNTLFLNNYYTNYTRCIREYPLPPPPPAVNDYYYSDGSFSTALESGKTPVGVIFWVNPDNADNFKVVSLDEVKKEWSTETIETGATGTTNGAENMAVIKAISGWHDKYPAFAWCDDKAEGGSGWYLPAKNEVQYLFCASVGATPAIWTGISGPSVVQPKRDTWNALFTAAGAVFTSDYCLSATENNRDKAWCVYFWNSGTDYYGKTSDLHYVRCVREI